MEINSSPYIYDTTINSEHEMMMNLTSPGTHFLQNLQSPDSQASPLLSNRCSAPTTLITDSPIICSLDSRSSNHNIQIPHLTCCYQQSAMIKDCHFSSKESKTVQTETFPTSEMTMTVHLNSPKQHENLRKQISFDFNSLKLKNPTISVRSRLLSDDDEERNRHLSDIELLRQVYEELRHKISQA